MSKDYLRKAGAYQIKVSKYKHGENDGKITYVLFYVEDTNTKGIAHCMFWMPREKDSDKATEVKKKILRDFLTNLKCDMDLKGLELLDDAVGREAKVVFREKDKMIYGKKDGKPIIVKNLEYYYSNPTEKMTEPNHSKLLAELTDWERNKYEEELKKWKEENNAPEKEDIDYVAPIKESKASTNKDDDDGLPF